MRPFNNKRFYAFSFHFKQLFLQGMEVTEVHRLISFESKPWLKHYIKKHDKEGATKNETLKGCYNLVRIEFFGKTMRRLQKRNGNKLCKSDDIETMCESHLVD